MTHIRETYRNTSGLVKVSFWLVGAAFLFLLVFCIVILTNEGFNETMSSALIMLMTLLLVFGSALLIGNTVTKAEQAGQKPPLARYILAFFGAVCLFMVPAIYLTPNNNICASGKLSVAIMMLIPGIALIIPILLYKIRKK